MAIATYDGLETAIKNWAHRGTELDDRIPEFVALVEARFWYGDEHDSFGNEPLRVRPMEASSDLTIAAAGTAALPTGFLAGVRMYISSGGTNSIVQYFPRTDFYERGFAQDAGIPVGYTIEGDNVVFGSAQTGTPKLLYYKKLDALDSTDGESTNAILTSNPMLYLSGALLELCLFIKEWDEAQIWATRFRGSIGGWNASDRRDRHIGPLIARPVAVA